MKLIEVVTDNGYLDTLKGIAEQHKVQDWWASAAGEDGRASARMLVADESTQAVLDALQGALGSSPKMRILVLPVEAALPRPPETPPATDKKKNGSAATREALYNSIEKNARLDRNFVILVVLSTIVAAIGLIEDNVAVVIGAMVIAPLLGPNLALALSTALGDTTLMWKALRTNLAGVCLTLILSYAIGLFWPVAVISHELLARTNVGLDSIGLALASGAAAVLSITTGLPSVLVGVMVAVALLPPAATFGLMLGANHFDLAIGAGLLLAVNVVCVNLAAKIVFLLTGLSPRTWYERQKARRAMAIYIVLWAVSLALLVFAIYLRPPLPLP